MATLAERGIKLTNSWAKFKNGMTTETWKELNPRMTLADDERRALAYMKWKTGRSFDGVVWAHDEAGVKRVRYVTVIQEIGRKGYRNFRTEVVEQVEIPHWNFAPAIIEEIEDEQEDNATFENLFN